MDMKTYRRMDYGASALIGLERHKWQLTAEASHGLGSANRSFTAFNRTMGVSLSYWIAEF